MADERMAKLVQGYDEYHKQKLANFWAKLRS
jgi:hypothetical protein